MMQLAMSSTLMNQPHILNKVSLEGNIYKMGYVSIFIIDESVVTRNLPEPNPVLPVGVMIQYLLIECRR